MCYKLYVCSPTATLKRPVNVTTPRPEFRSHLERRSFMIIKTFVFRDTSCPGEYGFVEEHTNGTLHLERIEQEIQGRTDDLLYETHSPAGR